MDNDVSQYQTLVLLVEAMIFLICLILSACFSGSETALTSMTKLRVKRLFSEGEAAYQKLEPWLKEPNRYLVTILVGNNFINILASVMAADFSTRILYSYFSFQNTLAISSALAVGVTTFLLLIFGEIVPKTYCKEHAVRISNLVIGPLDFMYKLLGPVIGMFLFISNRIIIIFGGEKIKEVPLITEEDVRALIEMSEKEGLLKEEERDMIHSLFDFGETIVKEIMTPRVDLAVLPINTTLEEARKKTVLCGHSRIPVYEKEIDQVIGILYAKDLLRLENGNQVSLREIIRPALFVPETTPLNILLQQFRKEKNHIAIVVDEYGVTVGIITIEDVLEEIVGDIQDEYDKEPPMYEINQDGTITANAKIYLDDLEEILQYVFPEKEVETLGGFVSTLMGTVPSKGEILIHDHLTFKILDADKRKIKRILIKENPPADQEDKDKPSE